MWSGLAQGELERLIIPAASIAANSLRADSNFSTSKRLALAKTGGPEAVGIV